MSVCLFFLRKTFATQKTQNKQKPSNKQKQANKKQQKQQLFAQKNFLRGRKWFILWFFLLKFLFKKIEIVLVTSFTILLAQCITKNSIGAGAFAIT